MKPEWKNAPEWAQYLVQNKDGTWEWHEECPDCDVGGGFWYYNGDFDAKIKYAGKSEVVEWWSSIEERPQ